MQSVPSAAISCLTLKLFINGWMGEYTTSHLMLKNVHLQYASELCDFKTGLNTHL